MSDIVPLLVCLSPYLSTTTLRQLQHIVFAMLCNPQRITMLGLSRWSEKGGSYRTMQRFYQSPVNWLQMHWTLIRVHVLKPNSVYLLVGDEVVVSKAGRETYGVGRFYSGSAQRVIPSVSFMVLSLVDVDERQSYPLLVEQLLPAQKAAAEPDGHPPKRSRGRPKGSQNHHKPNPVLSPLLSCFQRMIAAVDSPMHSLNVKHIVVDGKFGHYPATWMIR